MAKKVVQEAFPLVAYEKAPRYLQDNPYIRSGYRCAYTYRQCFWSVFRLHNETGNIYTHMLPIALYIYFFYETVTSVIGSGGTWSDVGIFCVYIVGVVLCFMASTCFHTLNAHSEQTALCWLTADYTGIFLLVVASFFPPIYYSYACFPGWRFFYLASISILAGIAIVCPFFKFYHDLSFRPVRIAILTTLSCFGLAPLMHFGFLADSFQIYSQPPTSVEQLGIFIERVANAFNGMAPTDDAHAQFALHMGTRVMSLYLLYAFAIFMYAARIPECFFPGKFDLFGQSHQIMHTFVAICTVYHYRSCLVFFEFYLSHPCPPRFNVV